MEGACLNMKPLHQSLPNPMPYGEQGNPQEVLKSLLSKKHGVPQIGPKSEQYSEESGPRTPATEPLTPLHLKSEAIRWHMHIIGI